MRKYERAELSGVLDHRQAAFSLPVAGTCLPVTNGPTGIALTRVCYENNNSAANTGSLFNLFEALHGHRRDGDPDLERRGPGPERSHRRLRDGSGVRRHRSPRLGAARREADGG